MIFGMSYFDFAVQAIGYVGLLFSVIAFQCKKHRRVMILKTVNEMLFALQYFFLGAYTGVAMNCVGSARNIIFAERVRKGGKNTVFQILFSVFFIVFGLATWQGYISIMVILAKVVSTVAYGMKSVTLIRLLTVPTSVCWLIYNYINHSWAGVFCEVFTLASLVSALIIHDLLPRIKAK